MKPYYDQNGITIYLGNCLEVIPHLITGGKRVDLIATDPAYRCISGGNAEHPDHQRCSGILLNNDGKIFEHNDISTIDYACLFYHILNDPAHCYLFINNVNLKDALIDFTKVDFGFHNLLVWKKSNATPNRWYMKDIEPILFFRKGTAFSINNPSAKSTLAYPGVPRVKKLHPTEKPVLLMQELISNSSQVGQTVLDPFCGSGSTLEAAYRTKRKAIGIEIDERYAEASAKRMEKVFNETYSQPLLLVA